MTELTEFESFDFSKLTDQLYALAEDVPFNNSDFQITRFIEQAALTPERRFRSLLLNATKTLEGIKENYYKAKRDAVELKILQRDLEVENDPLKRELIEIDIEEKMSGQVRSRKLVKDAEHTLFTYIKLLEKYPRFDREQFENAEQGYFEKSLNRQVEQAKLGQASGAIDSLDHLYSYEESKLLEAPELKLLGGPDEA